MARNIQTLNEKALEIHRRLCAVYGCPIPYFHSYDPISELVSSLFSHRTRNAESGRAYKALKARYPDWAAVRDARTFDIEATRASLGRSRRRPVSRRCCGPSP